jgi:leader peptidase (prepilin peptidase)/N-methyltransferase
MSSARRSFWRSIARNVRRPGWLVATLIVAVTVSLTIVAATYPAWRPILDAMADSGGTAAAFDHVTGGILLALAGVWVFVFGASIASFINVVAWRWPRGLSILGSSRCPRCRTKLQARENLPVVGWLWLGGRCRTCHLPISVRYVLVELVLGTVTVGLAAAELAGWSCGFAQAPHAIQAASIAGRLTIEHAAHLAYHVALVAVLLTLGLVRSDRQRLPIRLVVIAVLIVVSVPLALPTTQPVKWTAATMFAGDPASPRWMTVGCGLLVGAVVGLVIAGVARWSHRSIAAGVTGVVLPSKQPAHDWIIALVLVGAAMGWQATVLVAIVSAAIRLAAKWFGQWSRTSVDYPVYFDVFVAAALHVICWRAIAHFLVA